MRTTKSLFRVRTLFEILALFAFTWGLIHVKREIWFSPIGIEDERT